MLGRTGGLGHYQPKPTGLEYYIYNNGNLPVSLCKYSQWLLCWAVSPIAIVYEMVLNKMCVPKYLASTILHRHCTDYSTTAGDGGLLYPHPCLTQRVSEKIDSFRNIMKTLIDSNTFVNCIYWLNFNCASKIFITEDWQFAMWTVVAVGIWLLFTIICLVVFTYNCRRRAQPST